MQTTSPMTLPRFCAAAFLLTAAFLSYPLAPLRIALGAIPFWGDVQLFPPSALGLIAISCCLLFPERLAELWQNDSLSRVLLVLAGGILLLIFSFLFRFNCTADQFQTELFYLATPLAGIALARELKRLLPPFLLIVAFLLIAALVSDLLRGYPPTGLPGNWNWNWSLLLVSIPVGMLALPIRRKLESCTAAAIVTAWLPYLVTPRYTSLAALFSAVAAAGVLTLLLKTMPQRRTLLLILLGAIYLFLFLAATHIPGLFRQGEARVPLWHGATDLAVQSPLGNGISRFEGVIPGHLPSEYFLSDFACDRHPHPHNELLSYACGWGIPGIIWGLLLFYGLWRGLGSLPGTEDPTGLFLGWAALLLFGHGMLDVILATPFAGTLFLLLVGIFWSHGAPSIQHPACCRFPKLRIVAALLLITAAVLTVIPVFCSGLFLREAKTAHHQRNLDQALLSLERSIDWKPTPENLYVAAAIRLFDRQDPAAAIELYHRLPETGFPFYSHSDGRMARALTVLGRKREALDLFEREQQRFPYSALNAYYHMMALRRFNLPEEAEEVEMRFRAIMRFKGLRPEEIRLLIRYPAADDSPSELRILKGAAGDTQ